MSTKLVKKEIAKFLERNDAYVLCIRGKWGVGKTFAWSDSLKSITVNKNYYHYSYVSLFGLNSFSELKFAIFENAVILPTEEPSTASGFTAGYSKVKAWSSKHFRRATKVAPQIPFVTKFISGELTSHLSFQTISKQLICIDDVERRGKGLAIGDVLGLLSFLREQRGCKIILILNDEALDGPDKQEFEKNLEKVVDSSMAYEPSADEAAEIAVKNTDSTSLLIKERCKSLSISNIRVIKRAISFVEAVTPLLSSFDEQVLKSAVSSIVLFCWSRDQPSEAPSFEFLKNLVPRILFKLEKGKDFSPQEVAWRALLESYQYTDTDEFDLELMSGVRNGYFDPERLQKAARVINDKIIAAKLDNSFEVAWRRYHDSFSNDQPEVLDEIYTAFMKAVNYISAVNLDGTVRLFKDLGEPVRALELLDFYMKNKEGDRQFFDLEQNSFGDNVVDPDVRKAFVEKATLVKEKRDVPTLMLAIKNGWTEEELDALASTPVEEYREAFKSYSGSELKRMLSNVLQFDRISNATDKMKEISARARAALEIIGAESRINARRVNRYGVNIAENENQAE